MFKISSPIMRLAGLICYLSISIPSFADLGDVSGNGQISAYDATLAAQFSVGLISLTAQQQLDADVTCDSTISAFDSALIAKRAVGLTDPFPCEENPDSKAVTLQDLRYSNTLVHAMSPLPVIPDYWGWSYHGFPFQDECGPEYGGDTGEDYWNPWGQIFPDPSTPTNLNAGIEMGPITMYLKLRSTGRWHIYDYDVPYGGYVFLGESWIPEAPGTSFSPTTGPDGYQFFKMGMGGWVQNQGLHYWPGADFQYIPYPDVEAGAISMTARIVLQDPNGPDDRDQAKYLIGIGIDHRTENHSGPIDALLMNRHRYITPEWQTFVGTTVHADEVHIDPPPIHGKTW